MMERQEHGIDTDTERFMAVLVQNRLASLGQLETPDTLAVQLRNPLFAIAGLVDLLKRQDQRSGERFDRIIDGIARQTEQLSTLVEQLLRAAGDPVMQQARPVGTAKPTSE